jgi:hypothetical protein
VSTLRVGAAVGPDYRRALGRVGAGAMVCLAAFVLATLMFDVDATPVDFHYYLDAARDVRGGESPYPESSYAPLAILGALPFTFLATGTADVLIKVLLVLCLGATLYLAGVRDWRCYPLTLLWPPVISAVQTGNVTILFALAAALVWRFAGRGPVAGIALGASIAAKFVMWPLFVWLVAVGRRATAAWTAAAAIVLFFGSFAAIGWSTIYEYPDALRAYPEAALDGYSLDVLAADVGFTSSVAQVVRVLVGGAALAAVVLVGRRGRYLQSFVLAIGAVLACAPYVWLHYFALLVVPVALVRPRLAPLWFVPLGMLFFGAGTGNGSTVDAFVVVAVATLTLTLAFRHAGGAAETASPVATAPNAPAG